MLSDLLISSQATLGIVIAALCVFAVAVVLYGVFRKFNQMGWLPWQIIIIFLVMMLAGLIPETIDPDVRLWVLVAIFLITTVLVLAGGAAIRYRMLSKARPASQGIRVCNRVLGGVTALLGLVVIVGALAGLALPLCEYAIPPARDVLSVVFENSAYQAISGYLLDFFLITVFVSVLNGGYRMGIGRGLLTLLMCILTFAALILAIVFTVLIPGLNRLPGMIAGTISNPLIGAVVGYGVSFLIWFVLFFVIFCLVGFLLNKLNNKIRYARPVKMVSGTIMAIIFFLVIFVIIIGVNTLVYFMAEGGLVEMAQDGALSELVGKMQGYLQGVADAFTSSSFASSIYRGNPLRGII